MRLNYLAFLVLLSLLLISGCKDDDNPVNNSTPSVIMPLKIGNYWSYIDSTFNSDGSFQRVDSSKLGITGSSMLTYKGTNTEFFHWMWVNIANNTPTHYKWLAKICDDGLSFYGGISAKGTYLFDKSINAKYPVTKNESWLHYNYSYFNDSTFRQTDSVMYTCVATDSLIITGIGALKSVVYRYGSGSLWTYLCYSPDIGYVAYFRYSNNILIFKKTLYAKTILPKQTVSYYTSPNTINTNSKIDPLTGR
ncbi:MAG: hypothetical protein HUU54_11325 [Ignavibacteriaceae bacterium]|nr:hypothetical protein [Ignavibacteriaceae bacterium]